MSLAPQPTPAVHAHFATDLPELSVPWRAEDVPAPRLLVLNESLAAALGLEADWLRSSQGVRFLTGHQLTEHAAPVAQAYAGHQFGGYVPRLGDGRALLLGELVDQEGHQRDIHLKGSGPTPFARGGDGRAAVGPMLREYLISEAMHALGIPTTRALAVLATGRTVLRQEGPLPGAVLARVAASHLRVGSFQYARSLEDPSLLRRLADYAIHRHHPAAADAEQPYLALFRQVVAAQASLVARWLLVGFVHGVMNTDNMTISGETIDYGPCAFMDAFDHGAVYSSIDAQGRYAYGNQPAVAQWNLARFAEALLPLVHDDQDEAVALVTESLDRFHGHFGEAFAAGMLDKLGLAQRSGDEGIGSLIDDVQTLLQQHHVDYTGFFRRLSQAARGDRDPVRSLFSDQSEFDAWARRWEAFTPDPELMDRTNPVYIPRNHLVEEALEAAQQDNVEPLEKLLDAVTRPYEERPGLERYAEAPPASFGPYRTYCGT